MNQTNSLALIFLALFALTTFITATTLEKRGMRTTSIRYVTLSCAIVLFSESTGRALGVVGKASPFVYDPNIWDIEIVTGLTLRGFVRICHFITSCLYKPLMLIYGMIVPLVIIAAGSEAIHAKTSVINNLIVRFIIGAAISLPLYYVTPALAPNYYYHELFPAAMPSQISEHIGSVLFNDGGKDARNAMPSLHATWTILCFLAVRNSPFFHKFLGFLYVAVTLVTTIGTGEHYLLDWVAALPLVLFISSLVSATPLEGIRLACLAASSMTVTTWILVIRHAGPFVSNPWTLGAFLAWTLIVIPFLERQLFRRETGLGHRYASNESSQRGWTQCWPFQNRDYRIIDSNGDLPRFSWRLKWPVRGKKRV